MSTIGLDGYNYGRHSGTITKKENFPKLLSELFHEHIFLYLAMPDMMRFRGVCKQWKKEIDKLFNIYWDALASSETKMLYSYVITETNEHRANEPFKRKCFKDFFERTKVTWKNTLDMAIKYRHIILLSYEEKMHRGKGFLNKAMHKPWKLVIDKKQNCIIGYHRNEEDSNGRIKVYNFDQNTHALSIEIPGYFYSKGPVIAYALGGPKEDMDIELRDLQSVFSPS